MATESLDSITATAEYVDISVTYPALANADISIQNHGPGTVDVVFGPSSAKGPVRLATLDSLKVNAAHIWLRGSGTISVTRL